MSVCVYAACVCGGGGGGGRSGGGGEVTQYDTSYTRKTLKKGIEHGVVKFLVPFFFSSKMLFLANIE